MALSVISGTPSNVTANLTAQAAKYTPQLWKKGAELAEQAGDFFQEFEGSSKMSPIRVETDLSKGAGQKITFRNREGLHGDGGIGDELVGDSAEEWVVGAWDLEVDYVRHSTEVTRRTEDQIALQEEIQGGVNTDLGDWLGRKKTKHMSMMFREKLHATSQVFCGSADGVASVDAIKTGHTLSVNETVTFGANLKTRGGRPAMIDRDQGGNPIHKMILVAVHEALVTMKKSSDYKEMVRVAGPQNLGTNPLFKGGYVDLDGHVIREFAPIDHAGRGSIGSAMNAKAVLGVAIVDSTTTTDGSTVYIKGGGNSTAAAVTTAKYFEFFPLYTYRFTPADSVTVGSGTKYVLIYNLTGADAHKMGFFAYTANDGNKLTCSARLYSSATGIANTTVGNVTWNTAPWVAATKLTKAHPAGSLIIEANSYGVPIGRSFMLGADSARRGYGRFRAQRDVETHDGGHVKRTYITSVFGQTPTQRPDTYTPNVLCITHAISYAAAPAIPVVT